MNKAEEICKALKIDYSQVLNIYPYGSRIYGSTNEFSDEDYAAINKTLTKQMKQVWDKYARIEHESELAVSKLVLR